MRIIIVNQHVDDAIGGSEIQSDIIASFLKKLGHEVHYIIMNPRKNKYNLEYEWSVMKRPFFVSYISEVIRFKPDLIYWRFNKKRLLFATIISKILKVNFVFGVSAYSDTEKWVWNGREVFPDKKFSNKNSYSLYQLKYLYTCIINPIRSYINYLGFYMIDGAVVLNSEFLGKLPVKKEIKLYDYVMTKKTSFKWEKPFVLWVANIKKKKNPEKFIELVELYRNENVDFLMVGKIQDNNYKYLETSNKLPEGLYYLGPKPLMLVNAMLEQSLFLVHTCDPEGFGNNFMQAWYNEKPTISLYFDPEEIISRNKLGFVSGNVEQMIIDVDLLINNDRLRTDMGNRAIKFADEHFNPINSIKELESFLLDILNN